MRLPCAAQRCGWREELEDRQYAHVARGVAEARERVLQQGKTNALVEAADAALRVEKGERISQRPPRGGTGSSSPIGAATSTQAPGRHQQLRHQRRHQGLAFQPSQRWLRRRPTRETVAGLGGFPVGANDKSMRATIASPKMHI